MSPHFENVRRFEQWLSSYGIDFKERHRFVTVDTDAHHYEDPDVERAWAAWQAALSIRPEGEQRAAVIAECAAVCKKIADGCDIRFDADAEDFRSLFWGGGARQCARDINALAVSPLGTKRDA